MRRRALADQEGKSSPAPDAIDLIQAGVSHPPQLCVDGDELVVRIVVGATDGGPEGGVQLRRSRGDHQIAVSDTHPGVVSEAVARQLQHGFGPIHGDHLGDLGTMFENQRSEAPVAAPEVERSSRRGRQCFDQHRLAGQTLPEQSNPPGVFGHAGRVVPVTELLFHHGDDPTRIETRERPLCWYTQYVRQQFVTSVHLSGAHAFSKQSKAQIELVAGHGIVGDTHAGATVQHRSRVAVDPNQPNLRQVHLIAAELHDELRRAGFDVTAGDLGENITTRGINLLALPTGTLLRMGSATIEITGLRNPCLQIDGFRAGLMSAVLERDASGQLIRKAGVLAIVISGGTIAAGEAVEIELPPPPHASLQPV